MVTNPETTTLSDIRAWIKALEEMKDNQQTVNVAESCRLFGMIYPYVMGFVTVPTSVHYGMEVTMETVAVDKLSAFVPPGPIFLHSVSYSRTFNDNDVDDWHCVEEYTIRYARH